MEYIAENLGVLYFHKPGYLSKVTGSLSDEYKFFGTYIKFIICHFH